MPLVNLYTLLDFLREKKTIAPAFNTTNLETTLAIMEGLNDSGYPGIIQITPKNLELSGYEFIAEITKIAGQKFDVPIVLHLDHGKTFEDIKKAIQAGFGSVMIDGSDLDFEENIKLTKRVKEYCRCFNIPVEAELGAIGGKEDDQITENNKTDPSLVEEFVRKSGCDLLAVSVGNVHGLQDEPNIDLNLLKQISEVSPVPLVIHGGSGIPLEIIRKLREFNVIKINIASEIRKAFIQTVGKFYEDNRNEYNLVKVLIQAKKAVRDIVASKTRSINS
ncbi:MAG: fructose-1,6-bisphosphate aldolase [Caldibacillus debilis]|uniref:Fructose-1,6-bisphosphate aldolase n=1 Tax=Caldibacillus debilis TaxID=301148 RepID=A0A3E0K128_9BACI|nr:class II aldolase [Caldibacillus debilis]OUM83681.1 MAG: fructose-1,6-bisphosphate aldolase [Caldibacillus debilis]REJ26662.1 MAG: fructose-1,6-bisphosphate aldolase [Caldibacillus debilis]REJ28442.1 MAG: fructose-1,6-bisphosphate aldolase [Caldibacillus debilis]